MKRVLAVRQDNNGDVLLAGPALRAVRNGCDRLTLLCGPRGSAAAQLLPHVDCVEVWEAAWIDADPRPLDVNSVAACVARVHAGAFDEAVVFTSFHQSPLPMALLLRMAGVSRIGAISTDYPGTLLDVRHRVDDDVHEVERALSLVQAMGYALPAGDDGALAITGLPPARLECSAYIVVHPGCTVPARAWSAQGNRDLVTLLCERGHNVVVTGSREEAALTREVAGMHGNALDLGGRTTFAEFAAILRDAAVVVCGNTAAAHVASATRTPVVEIFPPTIPASRFHPWMTSYVLLGDQDAPCAGCRARVCPVPGQPCLDDVTPENVADAVAALLPRVEAAS